MGREKKIEKGLGRGGSWNGGNVISNNSKEGHEVSKQRRKQIASKKKEGLCLLFKHFDMTRRVEFRIISLE